MSFSESYYYLAGCPLEEDCRECRSGKNKHFWGKTPDDVKEKVTWHLKKSQYHMLPKEDAAAVAELCDVKFHEAVDEDANGGNRSKRAKRTPTRCEEEETPPPRGEEEIVVVDGGGESREILSLIAGAAMAAHRCKRIADEASVAFGDCASRLDILKRRYSEFV
jgi:hypothetical protein